VEGRCPPQCIGQDGQDGLIVSLGQAEAFAFEVNPFDAFGPVAEGAALHTSTTGSINGQPDLPLDDLTLSQTGGSVQITADFSRIGLPTARVQVLSNNVVVTDLPGLTGVVASAPDWPVVIGKLGGGAQILNCRVVRWPGSRLFSINGNAYQGDQLNVLAEGLNVNVDYISSFQILAGGMSDFTIVDEQVTPAAGQCPPMAPQIQALGNSHVITWGAGSYHLQVSDDFTTGIWSDLPGVSPMILPSTGAQRYYRLICH
jgi:hypothetical protein